MYSDTYRILGAGQYISNNARLGLNGHDMVIGTSGSQKTRSVLKPNILQCNESMIIADTKGNLYYEMGDILRAEGYTVLHLDFKDTAQSVCGYNPLLYIRYEDKMEKYNEQDILTVAAGLVPAENKKEVFWDLAARQVVASLIAYTLDYLPEDEHTLNTVLRLYMEMGTGKFDRLMQEICEIDPESLAAKFYKMYRLSATAEKMYASIQGIISEKLQIFAFDGSRKLFENPNQISFSDIAEHKTALFVSISDTDRSLDRLSNLFFVQAIQSLCNYADRQVDFELPVPVRIFLDDFACNIVMDDFPTYISVTRSRQIHFTVIIQSLSQLSSMYGTEKAYTILNNCDHLLYLGGTDVETCRYISIKANVNIHKILDMPLDSAWLFERGSPARQIKKFVLESHFRYPKISAPAA